MFPAVEAQQEAGFDSLLAKKRLKTYYSSIMRVIYHFDIVPLGTDH